MTEKQQHVEIVSEEWMVAMHAGLEEAIENYEIAELITFDPFTLSDGVDNSTWGQISEGKRKWILDQVSKEIGFTENDLQVTDTYSFLCPDDSDVTWEGEATVTIYLTQKSETDNIFVHKITRPNCPVEYVIAPKEHRI